MSRPVRSLYNRPSLVPGQLRGKPEDAFPFQNARKMREERQLIKKTKAREAERIHREKRDDQQTQALLLTYASCSAPVPSYPRSVS